MLAPSVIHEIKRLLKEGQHSRRGIAALTGVAPATVTAVAGGVRQVDDYLDRVLEREELGAARKCPSCGGTVCMPCKLCQTRELMTSKQFRRYTPIVDTPIGLNLKPEHQARYAEVRRWRREALRLGVISTPQSDEDVASDSS